MFFGNLNKLFKRKEDISSRFLDAKTMQDFQTILTVLLRCFFARHFKMGRGFHDLMTELNYALRMFVTSLLNYLPTF